MKRYKPLFESMNDKTKRFALRFSDYKHNRSSYKYFDTEKEVLGFAKQIQKQNKLRRYEEIELIDQSKKYPEPGSRKMWWDVFEDALNNELKN